MTKRKIHMIGALTVVTLFVVGFGFEQVRIFGNETLIDLDKAIDPPSIGNQGNSEYPNDEEILEEDNEEIPVQSDREEDEIIEQPEEREPYTYIVSIRGTTIKLDGREYSQDVVEKLLRLGVESDSSVYLVDDYAESQTYKSIRSLLQELNEEMGVSIIYE